MTGTGTNNNPYILGSYEDLESLTELITSTSNRYAEFDSENVKTIDMNEIYAENTPILDFSAYGLILNGNGWTIKNLHLRNNTWLKPGAGSELKNLTIESFYIDGNYSLMQFVGACSMTWNKVSGITCGSLFLGSSGDGDTVSSNAFNVESASESFQFFQGSESDEFSRGTFENNLIKLKTVGISVRGLLRNAKSVSHNLFEIVSTNAVKYLINGCIYVNDNCYKGEFSGISGIETVNTYGSYSTVKSVWNGNTVKNFTSKAPAQSCTEEQLNDAEYLSSIGFPIGTV